MSERSGQPTVNGVPKAKPGPLPERLWLLAQGLGDPAPLQLPLGDAAQLGSDPAASLRLDGPGVLPLHAHLERSALTGHLRVRASGPMSPADVDRDLGLRDVEITLGTRLRIGRWFVWVAESPEPGRRLVSTFQGLASADPRMDELFRFLQNVARGGASLSLHGAAGTGKSELARAVHLASGRSGGPFLSFDVGAFPASRIEAELFGDARSGQRGALLAAHEGTLLLGDALRLPERLQLKLLQFVEVGALLAVGARVPELADVRLLHESRDWPAGHFEVGTLGRLRRAFGCPLNLPPLTLRRGDVLALWERFVSEGTGRPGALIPDDSARARLLLHDWPGNVRELEALVKGLLRAGVGPLVHAGQIHFDDGAARPGVGA